MTTERAYEHPIVHDRALTLCTRVVAIGAMIITSWLAILFITGRSQPEKVIPVAAISCAHGYQQRA